MNKVVITFLQGTAVTKTVLGGWTYYRHSCCKFPVEYVCQKNSEDWLTANKVNCNN